MYKTFIKKLNNYEYNLDKIKEDINFFKYQSKKHISRSKSSRFYSKHNNIRVTKIERGIYNEPVRLENVLRKYSFNK